MMLKAIETVYNGYRFRSRLEARHAVFFDTLGIKYEYEPEGFELPAIGTIYIQGRGFVADESKTTLRYLPDFWLPEQHCFIEIKPQAPTEDEEEKCRRLALHLHQESSGKYAKGGVFLFGGELPTTHLNERAGWGIGFHATQHVDESPICMEIPNHEWVECPLCRKWGLAWGTTYIIPGPADLPCGCVKKLDKFWRDCGWSQENAYLNMLKVGDPDDVMYAYTAARQARFEHGEKP